eukprot:g31052.t1
MLLGMEVFSYKERLDTLGLLAQELRRLRGLVTWYNENNLSLNVSKTEELIINFRKKGGEHTLIYIKGTEGERVKSIKFLRVTMCDDLAWTFYVNATVKKAQQHLFFLRKLRKFAWYGNSSSQDGRKLQKVVCTAQTITEADLPSTDSI